jgi:hypothetical protein
MPEQLSQVAILGAWHPDPRKAIFQEQRQNVLRILTIRAESLVWKVINAAVTTL